MTAPRFITGAVTLGGYGSVAVWKRNRPGTPPIHRRQPLLIVMQSEQVDEGVLIPARDVTISGVDALKALRSAIDAALEGWDQETSA